MTTLVEPVFLPVVGWWLLTSLIALGAAPIAYRLFPDLADRGLNLARPLGLLLAGFAFWIGGSVHLFPPNRGAAVLVVAALGLTGLLLLGGRSQAAEPLDWVRANWQRIAVGEAIFALILLLWAVVRAYNPEIAGTEKPMELLFLNSVLRAESFPPADPWLAGSTVSYYYFGYVIVGMLARLAGTPAAVAFNLALALLMAMAAQGAFGLVTSLVSARGGGQRVAAWSGALGAFLLVGLGNLVGMLDFAISRGWGSPTFWQTVSIDGLKTPYVAPSWTPAEHWWWWKSTRVINTFRDGQGIDYTIAEFPIFSFVLGDLHPHVLALPFNLLVLALAASAMLSPQPWGFAWLKANPWRGLSLPVLLGALGFLNSWDLPTYAFVLFAAVVIAAYRKAGRVDRWLVRDVGVFVLLVGVASVVVYLPFYRSFSSQASGIRPVVGVATQVHHYLLFWAPLAVLGAVFLATRFVGGLEDGWRRTIQPAIVVGLAPIAAWLLATLPATLRGGVPATFLDPLPAKLLISLPLAVMVTLGAIVALTARSRADAVAALLIGVGFLLQLGAEHFFILDVFGSRMNTVFKLYYQSWTLLAVAGGYGFGRLVVEARSSRPRLALVGACTVLIIGGSYFTLAATWSKADAFAGLPTLDGTAAARAINPDEAAAIDWLTANAPGGSVLVEATGGQYSEYGRISMQTGLPTILGWAGHERQWRGSDEPFRGREQEIDRIYNSVSRDEVRALTDKYSVDYIVVGGLERQKYGAAVADRLDGLFDVAFENGNTTIFRVR